MNSTIIINSLPSYLWLKIFHYLNSKELLQLGRSSKYFYKLTHLEKIWSKRLTNESHLWQQLDSTWQLEKINKNSPKTWQNFDFFWNLKPKVCQCENIYMPYRVLAYHFIYLKITDDNYSNSINLSTTIMPDVIDDVNEQIPAGELFEILMGFVEELNDQLFGSSADNYNNDIDAVNNMHRQLLFKQKRTGWVLFLRQEILSNSMKLKVISLLDKIATLYYRYPDYLKSYLLLVIVVKPINNDNNNYNEHHSEHNNNKKNNNQLIDIVTMAKHLNLFNQPYFWNIFSVDSIIHEDLKDWMKIKHWVIQQTSGNSHRKHSI